MIDVDGGLMLGEDSPAGLGDRDTDMVVTEVNSGDYALGRHGDEQCGGTASPEAWAGPVFGDEALGEQILHAFGGGAAR
jgi:hypothetical protein